MNANSQQRVSAAVYRWLLRLLAALPYSMLLPLGKWVGLCAARFAGRRRAIAELNLTRCFPELDEAERASLVRQQFIETGRGIVELGLAWYGDDKRLQAISDIEGLENLERARSQGKGAILLSFHFTTLDLAGTLLARHVPMGFMYRPHNNPAIDAVITGGRLRYTHAAIPRESPRAMLKALKDNLVVAYYPDHDLGRKNSEFVPFFGIETAWVSAISRMAAASGAPVLPFFNERKADGSGLKLTILPPLDNFPTSDVKADLMRVSALLEAHLRLKPANYLWMHRRFKTRPEGEPPFYQ